VAEFAIVGDRLVTTAGWGAARGWHLLNRVFHPRTHRRLTNGRR